MNIFRLIVYLIMNYAITLLGMLLSGNLEQQRYIVSRVNAEYFETEALAEVFRAASITFEKTNAINVVDVVSKITTDSDSKALNRRLGVFREHFDNEGVLTKTASDDEVKSCILTFVARILTNSSFDTPVETVTYHFIVGYVAWQKKNILIETQQRLKDCPTLIITEEIKAKLDALDTLLNDNGWERYAIDFTELMQQPDTPALILRKGQDYFYRGNIYLISGFAGSMKSFLSLTIAAAAYNNGERADRTLSFCATSKSLKVLYADTELAENTLRKRFEVLKTMINGEYDWKRFCYLSLLHVFGGIEAKQKVLDQACRSLKPDLIVVDSVRDLTADFNDLRESNAYVAHLRALAVEYNAVVICTCHQSIINGNAKGHLGVRLDEMAALSLSLKTQTDQGTQYIQVDPKKKRDDMYEPFAFRFDSNSCTINEYAPIIDHAEESRHRQIMAAKAAVEKVLRVNDRVKYSDLKARLMQVTNANGKLIAESTAKNYIRALTGTLLIVSTTVNGEKLYSRFVNDGELPLDDDDLPPD